MDALTGTGSAPQAAGTIKDVADAQVVTKTLDKMNTAQTLSGPKIDAGYQLRKDVLNAAGIGNRLNTEA